LSPKDNLDLVAVDLLLELAEEEDDMRLQLLDSIKDNLEDRLDKAEHFQHLKKEAA